MLWMQHSWKQKEEKTLFNFNSTVWAYLPKTKYNAAEFVF